MTSDGRARPRPGVDAQRERILDAAVRVFAERGIGETRVEEVLVAAEVSRHTFYRCFDGKADLVDRIHERAIEEVLARSAALLADVRPSPRWIVDAVGSAADGLRELGPMARMLYLEAQRPGSPIALRRQRAIDLILEAVSSWCEATLGIRIPPTLARSTLLAVEQTLRSILDSDPSPEEIETYRRSVVILVTGALAGIGIEAGTLRVEAAPGADPRASDFLTRITDELHAPVANET